MAKKVSGIYSITNAVNGKRYYGSSVNVWGRQRQHWHSLRVGTHRNKHLQAAWLRYGEESFVFALLEAVPAERLLVVEQRYLDRNRDGYNLSRNAESAALGLKWSEEARRRFGASRKGRTLSDDHKKALSVANTGKKKSDTEKRAMSERMRGQTAGEDTRERIASSVKSLWEDAAYRTTVLAAQRAGRATAKAKRDRRAAAKTLWADPQYAAKMSAERKSRWSDPAYRAKMLEVRRAQGEKLRTKNREKQESCDALP